MDKKEIRQTMIKRRMMLDEEEYQLNSLKIIEKFLTSSFFYNDAPLGIYVPIKKEVNTLPLIKSLLEKNISIALPKVGRDNMYFYEINCLEDLELGSFNIYEPKSICKKIYPNVLIVPLVAFNRHKERIGYGKGYYDRYISTYHPVTIGFAFECQCCDFIKENHDQALDYIISEKAIYE